MQICRDKKNTEQTLERVSPLQNILFKCCVTRNRKSCWRCPTHMLACPTKPRCTMYSAALPAGILTFNSLSSWKQRGHGIPKVNHTHILLLALAGITYITVFWKIPKGNLLLTEFSLLVIDGLKSPAESTESFWNYVPTCNIYQYEKKKRKKKNLPEKTQSIESPNPGKGLGWDYGNFSKSGTSNCSCCSNQTLPDLLKVL